MTKRIRRSRAGEPQRNVVRKLHDHTGFIYLIGADGSDKVKIGFSNAPDSRLLELQTGSPVALRVLALIPGTRGKEVEIHERFAVHRSHGEWFRDHPSIRELFRLVEGGQ